MRQSRRINWNSMQQSRPPVCRSASSKTATGWWELLWCPHRSPYPKASTFRPQECPGTVRRSYFLRRQEGSCWRPRFCKTQSRHRLRSKRAGHPYAQRRPLSIPRTHSWHWSRDRFRDRRNVHLATAEGACGLCPNELQVGSSRSFAGKVDRMGMFVQVYKYIYVCIFMH